MDLIADACYERECICLADGIIGPELARAVEHTRRQEERRVVLDGGGVGGKVRSLGPNAAQDYMV